MATQSRWGVGCGVNRVHNTSIAMATAHVIDAYTMQNGTILHTSAIYIIEVKQAQIKPLPYY